MKLRELPFLPIHFFLKSFASPIKTVFGIIFLLLISGVSILFFTYAYPEYWSLDVNQIAETQTDQVVITELSHQYRTFPLELPAYRQEVTFSASPLVPQSTPIILFFIFQIVAWALLLSFASQIRSKWSYLFYLLFALFLHFSDVVRILIPEDTLRIAEFLVIAIFLGLSYAQQLKMLRWSLVLRFVVNIGLLGLLFGSAWNQGGFVSFHLMSISLFPYLLICMIGFLLFIGKEPTNLLFIAANNRPNPKSRLGAWPILIIYGLLFLIELFPTLDLLDFGVSIKDFGIRPLHLIGISALLTIFSSQNQYNPVKHIFSTRSVFSFFTSQLVINQY